jgi:hypothetical protein
MNERIKELMIQAMTETGRLQDVQATYQRFAELIINECLSICEELGDKGMDGHYCADAISKKFRS